MSEDLPPDLEDFEEVIEKIKPVQKENEKIKGYMGDYTKTTEELALEMQQKLQIQIDQQKKQQSQQQSSQIQQQKKEEQGSSFKELKKGFLLQDDIQEVKVDEKEKKKNKLEIPEVQKAMEMNNYLKSTQNEWMTEDLLNQVATNPKLQKMFTNPEYMQAITMMQTKPKEAMEKYGNNPEFMMVLQEFMKIMGKQMESLAKKEKQENNSTAKPQQTLPQQPKPQIQEIKKPKVNKNDGKTKEQLELEEKLKDPQVQEVMKDPKVQSFIQYLQTQKQVDFMRIMQADPYLAQRIHFLIQKGIINMQSQKI